MNRSVIRKETARAKPKRDYFADGFNARMRGAAMSSCPHRDPPKRRQWTRGYRHAGREGVGD